MRNWKRFFSSNTRVLKRIALVALFAGSAPRAGFALGDPLPEQSAYTEMLRADRMFKAEDFAGARIAYGAALDLFAALQEKQPDYKSAILSHRMEYCRKQLEALPQEEIATVPEPESDPAPMQIEEATVEETPPVETVPDVEDMPEPVAESVDSEVSIEQRERDLRRREESLKVALVGLQLERDRMRETLKQVEAERDLALRMLEDAGRKSEQTVAGDSEERAGLERKLEEFEVREALFRKTERDNETLREQCVAAREQIARLTEEAETLKSVRPAVPVEEPVTVTKAADEPDPENEDVVKPEAEVVPVDRSEAVATIESLIGAGRLDEAASACRAILDEESDQMDAVYGMARIDWKNGNRRAARRAAVRLSAAAPDRGDIQFFCGEVFQGENDPRRALACFEAAVASDKASVPYRKALAEGYVEAGRLEDALSAFCALTELDVGDGPAQFNRAALIVKLGDEERFPEAREAYLKALELGESSSPVLGRKLGVDADE